MLSATHTKEQTLFVSETPQHDCIKQI